MSNDKWQEFTSPNGNKAQQRRMLLVTRLPPFLKRTGVGTIEIARAGRIWGQTSTALLPNAPYPSVFGWNLQRQLVRGVKTRDGWHWPHAWQRFKRSKGVKLNGILECKFLSEHVHRASAAPDDAIPKTAESMVKNAHRTSSNAPTWKKYSRCTEKSPPAIACSIVT
jgi:hypothetical protein